MVKKILFFEDYNFNNKENWQHKNAQEYKEKIIQTFGYPDEETSDMALWYDIAGFNKVYIKDESILHSHPEQHYDYVYSTEEIEVPEDKVDELAKATESIIVDRLKNEVTVRCGTLYANAISIKFVEDVVAGNVKGNMRKEYDRRILEGDLPEWYENEMNE